MSKQTMVMCPHCLGTGKVFFPEENQWQQNKPVRLVDEGRYDIILDKTGEQVNDVEYWAFGGGFMSETKLEHLLPDVTFFRLHSPARKEMKP